MNRHLVSLLLALLLAPLPLFAGESPPLMLANTYRDEIPPSEYRVSEKLDGMRGYWDGHQLLTRGGEVIHAPSWFTVDWPETPLDGELWISRGQFSQTVSIVRQQTPDDAAWRKLRFMAFDLPAHPGTFDERNAALQQIVARIDQPWLQQVAQFKVANQNELQTLLQHVVKQGGEGLMLHRGSSLYRAERNDDLLKLKLFQDAEARVVAHLPGKGKYAGMLGALDVESPEGLHFRLGAGFSDAERRAPPPLGSWVSYRYNGLNEKTGIPRFARFLRVRADMSP
jgi:DNA ligase-1